ncbi:MAG: integrase, partial [Oricola sp.]|nr:integrase [Oricola sp.]
LLGAVEPAAPAISEAFDTYCSQIAKTDLMGKSDEQKANWKKIKLRAVNNFIAVCGDLPMDKIGRKEAQKFRGWWGERLEAKDEKKGRHPNSANRDIGNLRTLCEAFWQYEGEAERANPFDKLRFGNVVYKKVETFTDEWVRTKMLKPGVFEGLNEEAILIVYALIETGCRPSEIANLMEEHIILNHKIPHLKIRGTDKRELKSRSSIREIPLVGVSLEAMKRAPKGFPRYRDKGALLSASLLKTFKRRSLLPSENHRIYSFRHSFEKRMLEADLDYGLRCLLMGHHDKRPQYGDGGSLEFRRDQLLKIAHPFPDEVFSKLP